MLCSLIAPLPLRLCPSSVSFVWVDRYCFLAIGPRRYLICGQKSTCRLRATTLHVYGMVWGRELSGLYWRLPFLFWKLALNLVSHKHSSKKSLFASDSEIKFLLLFFCQLSLLAQKFVTRCPVFYSETFWTWLSIVHCLVLLKFQMTLKVFNKSQCVILHSYF